MEPVHQPLQEADRSCWRFAWIIAAVAVILSLVPALLAWSAQSDSARFLGHFVSTDDHMVYSAWMLQSAEGKFFFDNRFAVEDQPGQTVHFYFWLLGKFVPFLGLVGTALFARVLFSGLFVFLLTRLLLRSQLTSLQIKLGLVLTTFGAGFGFVVWDHFGRLITHPSRQFLAPLSNGLLPNDVWQTEMFVFPSMLSNGLFMASLCLILGILDCVLRAQESWKPVGWGCLLFGLLMNIHSYDVLLLALVLLGLVVCSALNKSLSGGWVLRTVVMALGCLPPALWFLHVLRIDPVFQSRAATPTYMTDFRALVLALGLPLLLGIFAQVKAVPQQRRNIFIGSATVLLILGYVFAHGSAERYWMNPVAWVLSFIAVLALVTLGRTTSTASNMLTCWAWIGLVAPYFPALFQRKLAAGLIIPWAILGALGLAKLIENRQPSQRRFIAVSVVLVASLSSLFWIQRDLFYLRTNVSSTAVHPIFVSKEVEDLLTRLKQERNGGRLVAIAPPGIPSRDEENQSFLSPAIIDLNPMLSGVAGLYTYAGHWSESPDFLSKREDLVRIYYRSQLDFQLQEILDRTKADIVVYFTTNPSTGQKEERFNNFGNLVFEGEVWSARRKG